MHAYCSLPENLLFLSADDEDKDLKDNGKVVTLQNQADAQVSNRTSARDLRYAMKIDFAFSVSHVSMLLLCETLTVSEKIERNICTTFIPMRSMIRKRDLSVRIHSLTKPLMRYVHICAPMPMRCVVDVLCFTRSFSLSQFSLFSYSLSPPILDSPASSLISFHSISASAAPASTLFFSFLSSLCVALQYEHACMPPFSFY